MYFFGKYIICRLYIIIDDIQNHNDFVPVLPGPCQGIHLHIFPVCRRTPGQKGLINTLWWRRSILQNLHPEPLAERRYRTSYRQGSPDPKMEGIFSPSRCHIQRYYRHMQYHQDYTPLFYYHFFWSKRVRPVESTGKITRPARLLRPSSNNPLC